MKYMVLMISFLLVFTGLGGCGAESAILQTGDAFSTLLMEKPVQETLLLIISPDSDIEQMQKHPLFTPVFDENYTYLDIAVQNPVLTDNGYVTVIDAVLTTRFSEEYFEVSYSALWKFSGSRWCILEFTALSAE